jgi:RHS repeat-associated protein
MLWNAQNELYSADNGTFNTYFNYSGGQRIRKISEKTGAIIEERIYLGSYERYRKYISGTKTIERITVHIADDTGRVAMEEKRTFGSDSSAMQLTRYIYSNHLSTASLELDEDAEIISYEEYHPYGTTAYQAMNASINAVAKRYRYTGKERDEETGLYYHGARYYIPWLCRWTAVDPMENKYAGMSPYNYGFNNPIKWQDANGMDPNPGGGSKDQKALGEAKNDQSKVIIANVNNVELSSTQVVDAMKIASSEVQSRILENKQYEIGQSGSIKSLGISTIKYLETHKLSHQQIKEFHSTVNRAYTAFATLAFYSKNEFSKLDKAVLNNNHVSDNKKVEIAWGRALEGYINAWSFMFISSQTAQFIASAGVGSSVGPGPKGPRINSTTQQRIVTFGSTQPKPSVNVTYKGENVPVYRGGNTFNVKPGEVKIDTETGFVKSTHGISLDVNPNTVEKYGGAYQIDYIPSGLKIIQRGGRLEHFEIVPEKNMKLENFQSLLNQIKVSPYTQ